MGRAAPCLAYCCVISPKQNPLTPSHCMNLNSRVVWADYVALWSTLLLCFPCAAAECLSREHLMLCRETLWLSSLLFRRALQFIALVKVFQLRLKAVKLHQPQYFVGTARDFPRLYANCMNLNLLCPSNTTQFKNECGTLEMNVISIYDVVERHIVAPSLFEE